MIVDSHTHVFPPQVASAREVFLTSETVFAELYADPEARIATASELLTSMDAVGIDVSVAAGFAWRDLENVHLHNDYLLEAAAVAGGRLLPFCTLPLADGIEAVETEMRRCVEGGAPGFGELRPGSLGFELDSEAGRRLGALTIELDVVLLFHVSEPVGHAYAGKQGLDLAGYYAFLQQNPGVRSIGAHWGGGLPFYALMPEVREAFATAAVDTAASSLLYDPGVYRQVGELIGSERILFASDYPLQSQARSRERVAAALDADTARLVLGENARRFLKLP